jgi:hypothetical protein
VLPLLAYFATGDKAFYFTDSRSAECATIIP